MEQIIILTALGDNYIYLYKYDGNNTFAVDPGDAGIVLTTLDNNRLNLTDVLVTHHHFDHTGGIQHLYKKTGCNVIDAGSPSKVKIANTEIDIISTPGHTKDSVCYYVQPEQNHSGILFTGDTLFIGGCGRPMECNPVTLWKSLEKLIELPDDTLIYPGHNYTEENYEFSLSIEPDNASVQKALQKIRDCKKQGINLVPSSIGQEKMTNIFLKAGTEKIKFMLNMPNAADSEVFAELRRRKNIFG